MRKNFCAILFGMIIAIIIHSLSGCSQLKTPPSFQEVESILLNNREDFDIITNYLITSEDVSIFDPTATLVGYSDVTIDDKNAKEAMERLVSKQILSKVFKYGNTIDYVLWESPFDIGCGLAYAIDHRSKPNIEFLTQLEPISIDGTDCTGWYYYVDDYNTWRSNNS